MSGQKNLREAVVDIQGLQVALGTQKILDGLSLDVRRGEILGIVGGSGSGKSVLLRTIIGLLPKQAGTIRLFGEDRDAMDEEARRAVERRWGVMFQQGALFSSLTVRQNIQFQMREVLGLSDSLLDEMAMAKLEMVGLNPDDALKMPAELSGGMTKRAALARALALDPEFVFLDEPTSGLDPLSAADFDELIMTLRNTLGLTVFMVTHDLESLRAIASRIAVLADCRVVAEGTFAELARNPHPWVKSYFSGNRAAALRSATTRKSGRSAMPASAKRRSKRVP